VAANELGWSAPKWAANLGGLPAVQRDAAGNFALDSQGLLVYRLQEGLLTNKRSPKW